MALGGFIKNVFSEPECKQCRILQSWLDIEIAKRNYYEELLLTKAGILHGEKEIEETQSFQSVHRITTASSIRKMAQSEMAKNRAGEKPDAVKKFEDALNEPTRNN